jgi:hypothetical protein
MALIAHYKLADNADTDVVVDETGNNNGTLVNGLNNFTSENTTDGAIGEKKALSMTGNGTKITTTLNLDLATTFSLSFWIRRSTPWISGSLCDKFNSYGAGKVMFETRDGYRTFRVRYGSRAFDDLETRLLNLNEWYHIVWTHKAWDGNKHEYALYLNGVIVGKTHTGIQKTDATALSFGKSAANYYAHDLDEVRVYDEILSEADIKELAGYNPNYGTIKTAILKTKYPIEDGITARTTSQTGHVMSLVPETSLVPDREKVGF